METERFQRHSAWKKNARHLYESSLVFELPWPSLTVQFSPEIVHKDKKTVASTSSSSSRQDAATSSRTKVQRISLGTNTGGQAPEYIRVGESTMPESPVPTTSAEYDSEQGTIGGFHSDSTADFRIVQRILAEGVVSRLRYMPQNPNVVASVASTGEAAIWDVTKFPYKPVNAYVPTTKSLGHTSEVLTIDWSPLLESELATGDADGQIKFWSMIMGYDARTSEMQPKSTRSAHAPKTAVNDLQWHPRNPQVSASVGDDGWLFSHNASHTTSPLFSSQFVGSRIINMETRASGSSIEPPGTHPTGSVLPDLGTPEQPSPETKSAETKIEQSENTAHLPQTSGAEFTKPTCSAWNPVNDSSLVIGFDNGDIESWDVRTTEAKRIHRFPLAHAGYVTRVAWNTYHPSVFASASEDHTVKVWDAALIAGNNASSPNENPMFVHGGHEAAVTDLCWNPGDAGTIVSVAEDNSSHLFRPSDDLIGF